MFFYALSLYFVCVAAIFASLTGKIGYIVNMCRMKGGACFAKYTFAHMKMCAWLSRGKCLICGIFFRFCCVFVKRMIEFVKNLYFFVFLFIKKLTKHKGGGILYLTEIMTAFCVYADL